MKESEKPKNEKSFCKDLFLASGNGENAGKRNDARLQLHKNICYRAFNHEEPKPKKKKKYSINKTCGMNAFAPKNAREYRKNMHVASDVSEPNVS